MTMVRQHPAIQATTLGGPWGRTLAPDGGRRPAPDLAPGFFSLSWSLPGTWLRRGGGEPQDATRALPARCRVLPPEPAETLLEEWPRYREVELVGVGGMGRVYRARDRRSDRTVALKLLLHGGDGDEAALQALPRHPGVLPVLDAGTLGDYPWFTMPFVDGLTLKAAQHGLRMERKLDLMVQAARTVEAIHRAGVVHCDLNPRNLLVAGPPESAAARLYVIDFGIACRSTAPCTATSDRVVGTPAYMAPEQALGKRHRVDPRTDVYGLGATLYELVCGRRPFNAETSQAVLTKAIREEPRPIHDFNADVPERLETVVLTCLEKDPADRYPTAEALAGALEDCLQGH